MSITAGWLLLNLAYLIYTTSGLFTDMLRLRVVWALSTLFFLSHGLVDRLWPAVWWNLPVLVIHIYMISQLLKARRGIDLDEEAEALRALLFGDLDRASFNTLWHSAQERAAYKDDVLITKGEPVPELFMILDGEIEVEVSDELKVRLSQFRMVGEMSTLSGSTASASVTALGTVRMRVWDKAELAELGRKMPDVQVAMLQAMGHEVARKLG